MPAPPPPMTKARNRDPPYWLRGAQLAGERDQRADIVVQAGPGRDGDRVRLQVAAFAAWSVGRGGQGAAQPGGQRGWPGQVAGVGVAAGAHQAVAALDNPAVEAAGEPAPA